MIGVNLWLGHLYILHLPKCVEKKCSFCIGLTYKHLFIIYFSPVDMYKMAQWVSKQAVPSQSSKNVWIFLFSV